MKDELVIDGSYGEGGGQILRTALTLGAIGGRRIRFENIRAGRKNPGLAAQHLMSVRAAAAICNATLHGDELESQKLNFSPGGPPRAGQYQFDVSEARKGGSAGSASLVLQVVLLPLAIAPGISTVTVRGGTHVPWSPPAHCIRDVYLPILRKMGVEATVELKQWGWFPAGGGELFARIEGNSKGRPLAPLQLVERGHLLCVRGCAAGAKVPDHVPRRMAEKARELLANACVPNEIEAITVPAACAGAGIFLTALYENTLAGFSALGRQGLPAEKVAEEAISDLLAHWKTNAALERHLADQVLMPAALAEGDSCFSVERRSRHFATVAWLVEQFGLAKVRMDGISIDRGKMVTVERV